MKGPRASLTTPQAVMADHGGELHFWLAWLSGELNRDLEVWFREQAPRDPGLKRDLESIDRPAARVYLHDALEATNYLAPYDPSIPGTATVLPGLEALTGVAVGGDEPVAAALGPGRMARVFRAGAAAAARKVRRLRGDDRDAPRELRRRVGHSLFSLLAEVEVPLPRCDEALEATVLLGHLVGLPAVDHFRRLELWLRELRGPAPGRGCAALDRVLSWLTPELFEMRANEFCFQISFRRYLCSRLKEYCKQRGWRPVGPRYRDLDSAFAQLRRERIGDIIRQALHEAEGEGLAEAKVSSRQVLGLLQAAP